jgi:predicted transcriptional regulator
MTRSQLKVSTKAREALQKEEIIKDYLRNHPEGSYPKNIVSETSINHSTVRSVCIRMAKKGIIKIHPIHRGMYLLVENDGHGMFSWNFHNTYIFYKSDKPLVEQQLKVENSLNSLFKYRFIVGAKSNKASMNISTKYPFNLTSLGLVVEFFRLLMNETLRFIPKDSEIWISSIELNKDYYNLRLDGIKCITWDSLVTQYKIYNKKIGVREESKHNIEFNFKLFADMVNYGIITSEITALLDMQDKKIDLLFKNQNKMNMKQEMILRHLQKENKMKTNSGSYL